MSDQRAGEWRARVLAHDGQVLINDLTIERPLHEIRIPVSPRLRDLLASGPSTHPDELAPREVRAVYEQTADDGTRIYRVKVDL